MGDARDAYATGKHSDTTTLAAFPQIPGEDCLAHAGALYMEQVDARLADLGLLAVAKDGADPDSVKALIDYDLSLCPELAPTHPQYHRNLETRMRYNMHNASNAQKRLSLRYAAWTKVYSLFKISTETTAPVFTRELLEKCSFEKLHGMNDGYFDGPRAYGLVRRKVLGATRTKADKNFYRTAERLQLSNRLSEQCRQWPLYLSVHCVLRFSLR